MDDTLIRPMGTCPTCGSTGLEPCTYPVSLPIQERKKVDRWHVHDKRPEAEDGHS